MYKNFILNLNLIVVEWILEICGWENFFQLIYFYNINIAWDGKQRLNWGMHNWFIEAGSIKI